MNPPFTNEQRASEPDFSDRLSNVSVLKLEGLRWLRTAKVQRARVGGSSPKAPTPPQEGGGSRRAVLTSLYQLWLTELLMGGCLVLDD